MAPYVSVARRYNMAVALPKAPEAKVQAAEVRAVVEPVPWSWTDAARIAVLTVGITAGAAAGVVLVRLLASFGYLIADAVGLVPAGSYDRFLSTVGPYGACATLFAIGMAMCLGLAYAVYHYTASKYHVSFAALGLRCLSWKDTLRVAGLFVPVTLCGGIIGWVQQSVTGASSQNQQLSMLTRGMAPSPANFVMLGLLLVVLAPLAEELLFRGFLYRLLRQRLPAGASIAISASVFAALHCAPTLFPWMFVVGVVFGLVVEKTQSLYASILLHAMINALALAGLMVALSSGW